MEDSVHESSKKQRNLREMEDSVQMECSSSPAPDWKAAVETLIRGSRDSASMLRSLLQDHAPGSPTIVLAEEVVSSISRALLVLDDCGKPAVPRTSNPSPPFSDYRQNEVSSGKKKITPARRGYKCRSHPYSCTRITTKTINDAYTWRKYGQKLIYNATFPRSYYRCTHKPDRGCQARRQVQQSEEDPTMFVITYKGEHTCRSDPNKASTSGSYFISFGSETTDSPMSASLPLPELGSDEVVSSDRQAESSLSQELMLPEDLAFEVPTPFLANTPDPSLLSPDLSSDITIDFSRECLEVDFMGDNDFINLDELFNFKNDEQFRSLLVY